MFLLQVSLAFIKWKFVGWKSLKVKCALYSMKLISKLYFYNIVCPGKPYITTYQYLTHLHSTGIAYRVTQNNVPLFEKKQLQQK